MHAWTYRAAISSAKKIYAAGAVKSRLTTEGYSVESKGTRSPQVAPNVESAISYDRINDEDGLREIGQRIE
jgi:hypothetical protein